MNVEVLLILLLTSVACACIGVFLFLRNLSMMTDAISHTILLGIVIGFFISHSLNSPIFIFCGIGIGLLSSWMINMLKNTKKVNEDAAIGIVFPLFFGLAVILLTLFAKNVHIDLDAVLLGEVTFAPLSRMNFLGMSLPTSLVWIAFGTLINLAFIALFYKELKITSFDPIFATLSGFSLALVEYALIALVSLTSVIAFDAVGSILVIALMIGPAITARLLVDELAEMLIASINIGIINCLIGYFASLYFDISVAGTIATVSGLTFLITVLLSARQGVIVRILKRRDHKRRFEKELLLLHLRAHEDTLDYHEEAGRRTILNHLHWNEEKFQKISAQLILDNEIEEDKGVLYLTNKGKKHVDYIQAYYGLPILAKKSK